MESNRIAQTAWQGEKSNPRPYLVWPERSDNIRSNRHLCYASKLFPLNALVTVTGRQGIYRVVSEPFIPEGYSYPHFEVEAFGKRFSVSVFDATRVVNSLS